MFSFAWGYSGLIYYFALFSCSIILSLYFHTDLRKTLQFFLLFLLYYLQHYHLYFLILLFLFSLCLTFEISLSFLAFYYLLNHFSLILPYILFNLSSYFLFISVYSIICILFCDISSLYLSSNFLSRHKGYLGFSFSCNSYLTICCFLFKLVLSSLRTLLSVDFKVLF